MARLPFKTRMRCEAIASDWRAKLNLYAYDPLPANDLARSLEAELRQPSQMQVEPEIIKGLNESNAWFGVILCFEPILILYHPELSPVRYESTIMHELAHILLKHPPTRLYMAPDGTFKRDFDSKIEIEAAYLGSCLQIPRRGLRWAQERKMTNLEIMQHFGTSREMLQWRINMLG